jgi:hypothetical protein
MLAYATPDPAQHWNLADKDKVHGPVFAFVNRIEIEQSDVYDRLLSLESLYDKHSPDGNLFDDPRTAQQLLNDMAENVIARNVDTTYAAVATAEIRARFLTDGADWSTQRRAAKLEFYSEGLAKQLDVHRKCRLAFKEAAKKGAGLVKVYADRWDDIAVEHIALEDVVVPDVDNRSGAPPLQLHHVQRNYDKARLRAEFPDAAEAIDSSLPGSLPMTAIRGSDATASGRPGSKIAVIESWILPIGKKPKGDKGKSSRGARYVPGRHTITIANKTLLDEPYDKPYYPIAVMSWSERKGSFYPISGAERIAGIQRALNKRNWTIERMLLRNAFITTYLRPSDFGVASKTTEFGEIVPIKSDYPEHQTPPAVHPELYKSREDLKQSAAYEFGQSDFSLQSRIPAGLETGAAVREARESITQRFAPQEADFERLVLDAVWLMIDACKELGKDAPTIIETRWQKPIRWRDVDMGQVRIQIEAASTLPRSAAGREQTILEWAQAGVISTDSFRRLINHPDLQSEMSMYTAALDVIDMQIEAILDGGYATPEPYDNLKMIEWRGTGRYDMARIAGAPEEVLESLRDYISQAAYLSAMQAENDNAAAPGAQPGMAPPGIGEMTPPSARPQAALAPEAMNLQAFG